MSRTPLRPPPPFHSFMKSSLPLPVQSPAQKITVMEVKSFDELDDDYDPNVRTDIPEPLEFALPFQQPKFKFLEPINFRDQVDEYIDRDPEVKFKDAKSDWLKGRWSQVRENKSWKRPRSWIEGNPDDNYRQLNKMKKRAFNREQYRLRMQQINSPHNLERIHKEASSKAAINFLDQLSTLLPSAKEISEDKTKGNINK